MSKEFTAKEYIELVQLREQLRDIHSFAASSGYPNPTEAITAGRQTNDIVRKIREILDAESAMKLSTAAALHQVAVLIEAIEARPVGKGLSVEQLDNLIALNRHR